MSVTDQKYFTGDSAVKLAAAMEQGIHRGALASGQQLPTIRELAARNRISPATVASAFRLLRTRGLVAPTAGGDARGRGCPWLPGSASGVPEGFR